MSAPRVTGAVSDIRKAVLPAAGLGTRLQPLTRAFPKELLPVGRLPVLAHIAKELRLAGITEALFVISERKPQIPAYFGEHYLGDEPELPPLNCHYVVQTEQRGLGDALLCAESWVGTEAFAVAFGDCLIEASEPSAPLRRLVATHLGQGATATTLVETVPWERVSRYGVLAPVEPGNAVPIAPFAASDIVEKPAQADAPSNLVVAARWILHPSIFDFLRGSALDARGERNLTDAVRGQIRAGGALWAVPLLAGEHRRDIGNFESFFTAFVRAALRDEEFGAAVRRVVQEEEAV